MERVGLVGRPVVGYVASQEGLGGDLGPEKREYKANDIPYPPEINPGE